MLEFKGEDKVDVYEWMCDKAREQAKAKCLSRDEKRSQELSGGALELVGSSDDGHEEEVPEAELRTSREAAESWKEQPMPGGKVIACESGDGEKRFVKRKTETSVTELKRWCCGPPVEVLNTEGVFCVERCRGIRRFYQRFMGGAPEYGWQWTTKRRSGWRAELLELASVDCSVKMRSVNCKGGHGMS